MRELDNQEAVLVHGCFWHHHSHPECRNAVIPKTRRDWWQAKLSANAARDASNLERLRAAGWEVLVIWACEVRSGSFAQRVAEFLTRSNPLLRRPCVSAPGWDRPRPQLGR